MYIYRIAVNENCCVYALVGVLFDVHVQCCRFAYEMIRGRIFEKFKADSYPLALSP